MLFRKAERKQAKLRLALSGPSGSGKTTGALMIAKGIGGKIAVLDTERGSASLYADIVDFDVVELAPPYSPERYIEIIKAAEQAGYTTLILDSITHEWNGQGGVLEIVDNYAKAKLKGNTYMAWGEGTPRHQSFIEAMLNSNCHIIATMRSKTVYETTQNERGKLTPQKIGTAPQQRDGMDYEFTAVLDIDQSTHLAMASKDRTRLFADPQKLSEETGKKLLEWLNSGKSEKAIARDEHKARSAEALSANPSPLSDRQRKAIFAYLNDKYGENKDAKKAEMENFLGRKLDSFNSITSDEASSFIDAINYGIQEYQEAV